MKSQLEKIEDEIRKPKSLFQRCREIDCKDIIKQNYKGINYIPWADMWAKLHESFENVKVEWLDYPGPEDVDVEKSFVMGIEGKTLDYPQFSFKRRIPYLRTGCGYFVGCKVTIEDVSLTCELPVMGSDMGAAREPDARDINDNKMRCFVKCCAMHGLGLSVYEKDDIYSRSDQKPATTPKWTPSTPASVTKAPPKSWHPEFLFTFGKHKGKTFNDIPYEDLESYIQFLKRPDPKKTSEENQKNYKYNEVIFKAFDTWKLGMKAIGAAPKEEEPPPPSDVDYSDIPF